MENSNIKITTLRLADGSMIKGKMNVQRYNRIVDFLNRSEDPFVVVYDVAVAGSTDMVAVINKSQIVWASPDD